MYTCTCNTCIIHVYAKCGTMYHWKQPHHARPNEYRDHYMYACMWCLTRVFCRIKSYRS